MKYLLTFCKGREAANDVRSSNVVGPIVLDKCVKFRSLSLNHSREIPAEAVGGGVFDSVFAMTYD